MVFGIGKKPHEKVDELNNKETTFHKFGKYDTQSVRDIVSEISSCCQTLDIESIHIIIEFFAENGNFILSGDTSCNLNLPQDLRYKFNSIEADSMLNDEKLKEFLESLVIKLKQGTGKLFSSLISDNRYYVTMVDKFGIIDPCVTMVSKEFTLI